MPELASREHQKNIAYVVNRALEKSDIKKNEIDGIAVTYEAGLKGALLVGLNFAKGMSMALNIPLWELIISKVIYSQTLWKIRKYLFHLYR